MTTECQYIGPDAKSLKVCGCTRLWPGKSYCEEHVWLVYQKGSSVGNKRKNKAIEAELAEIKRLEEIDVIDY